MMRALITGLLAVAVLAWAPACKKKEEAAPQAPAAAPAEQAPSEQKPAEQGEAPAQPAPQPDRVQT